MIKAIAPVAALLLGVAILLTGQGLSGVLLPVRANLEGFSTLAVGSIGAFYFVGFTLGCWKGAAFIKRVGHVRVFAAMTALASASPLIHGLWVNLLTWGVLRVVSGFCFAVLYVVIESWLNEQSDNDTRGTIFSAYILINMTVLAVGQQMLLLDDPMNLDLFALTSVLVSLAAVPVALSTASRPGDIEDSKLDIGLAWRTSHVGMLGSLGNGLSNGSFWALAPVFVSGISHDVGLSASYMTACVLGGAAGQFPLGRLSDRTDRRYILLGISLCAAVVCAVLTIGAAALGTFTLLALGFTWGVFSFPIYSISVAHANDRAQPGTFVVISSALLLMYGVGAISGPLLASLVMGLTGERGLYLYIAAIHAALAAYVTWAMIRRQQVRRARAAEFEDALASALTSSQVYAEEELDR